MIRTRLDRVIRGSRILRSRSRFRLRFRMMPIRARVKKLLDNYKTAKLSFLFCSVS